MRFLIVDDDYVSRTKLFAILSEFGECDTAQDGHMALKMVDQALLIKKAYSLITLDIEMPGISGTETLHMIREKEQSHGIVALNQSKAFMISSHDTEENVTESYTGGAKMFLSKPVTPEKVKEALKFIGILQEGV